jgi:multidrug efflux system outer membrane protein
VARSQYYPAIGYEAGVQRDHGVYRSHPELSLPASGQTQNLFLAGLSVFWEADIWGRIRRSNQAALAEFLGSEQGRRGLMLSLVSDVAQAYFELQELDRRLAIARNSTAAFQSTHALFNRRFHAGITSLLAVKRAESALADASGTMSAIELQIGLKEHQIGVLLGREPGVIQRGAPNGMAQAPPVIPAGLPAALLERRPDLLQAEQSLVAASARIGVAKADFFPRIGLTGLIGRVSPELSQLTGGASGVAALAASGAGPIFTGGQLTGQYRAAGAVFEETKFQYFQQVLKAF